MIKCLLDMDGVVADFIRAIHIAHNRPYCYDDPRNRGIFETEKLWGMSLEEFWKIDTQEFWENVPQTPEADQIVGLVTSTFGLSNVAILTSPSNGSGCIPGKKTWMQKRYPRLAKRMIFGGLKEFLASPNRVLIDDRDENIRAFRESGGRAILVPRHWNSAHDLADRTLEVLKYALLPYKSEVPKVSIIPATLEAK